MKPNTSLTNSKTFATEPFHKLMPSQLREMYSLKLLDTPAYVLLIVQTHGAAGWKWTFKVKDFCQEWGISKSAFYRAVSKLKDLNLLNWETDDSITVWHGSDIAKSSPTSGNPVPPVGIPVPPVGIPVPPVGIPVPLVGIKNAEILDGQGVKNSPYLISNNTRSTTNNNIAAESKKFASEQDPEGSYLETEKVFNQLRSLGIKLNPTVRKVVISHAANVQNAIAHIQERISERENFKCLEAAFVNACKEGRLPKQLQSPPTVFPQPSPAQFEALEIAKRNGSIRDYYSSPYRGGRTVLVDDCHNRKVVIWWEFLEIADPMPV
jgi:hypothetical protein